MSNNNLYINDPYLTLSPACEMVFIKLAQPDEKFGKYQVTLLFDPKDKVHAKWIKAIKAKNQEVFDEKIQEVVKGKKSFHVKEIFKAFEDAEGNDTGKLYLKVNTMNKPVVKDAAGVEIPFGVLKRIFQAKGRVIVSLKKGIMAQNKNCGLIFYLNKVQIIETLNSGGGAGASQDFDVVEGGFSVADADAPEIDEEGEDEAPF